MRKSAAFWIAATVSVADSAFAQGIPLLEQIQSSQTRSTIQQQTQPSSSAPAQTYGTVPPPPAGPPGPIGLGVPTPSGSSPSGAPGATAPGAGPAPIPAVPGPPPGAPRRTAETGASALSPPPFGANLFNGQFAAERANTINPAYVLAPGDRVVVQMWGAVTFDGVLTVDYQGNVFLPEIGPIPLSGVSNGALQGHLLGYVRRVFTDRVQVYSNLITSQPIGVFVTGGVPQPGRYAGDRIDSAFYFLDRARGIDPIRGSYRDIRVIRDGRAIASIDLYEFLSNGAFRGPAMRDGDTIVVGAIGSTFAVEGEARHPNRIEFLAPTLPGGDAIRLARPLPGVTHVALRGVRNGRPYNAYVDLAGFAAMTVADGDTISFQVDRVDETIFVSVVGHSRGPSIVAVPRNAKIGQVLDLIEVDPTLADTESIYLRRKSVADRQAAALEAALQNLERTVLTATSSTSSEAEIRRQEADLVARFVEKARTVRPEGRVVLAGGAGRDAVQVEKDDVIVIPQKSDVVLISGEVLLPQTVVHRPGGAVADYVRHAGGYNERADRERPLIVRASGVIVTDRTAEIRPGDHILILARPDSKDFAVVTGISTLKVKAYSADDAKDIVQVVFQIATAAAVVLRVF